MTSYFQILTCLLLLKEFKKSYLNQILQKSGVTCGICMRHRHLREIDCS